MLNIVNLAIQHRPAAMFRRLNIQHLKPAAHGLSHNADNAARANVQGEDHILFLRSVFRHIADAPFVIMIYFHTGKTLPEGGLANRPLATAAGSLYQRGISLSAAGTAAVMPLFQEGPWINTRRIPQLFPQYLLKGLAPL